MSADPSPIVSAETLLTRAGEPGLRIVDVRWTLGQPGAGRRAYDAGHIPAAIFLDLDGDLAVPPGPGLAGRHPLPSPAAFAATLARVGIGPDDLVVAYDDVGGWVAARLWWMLDDLGHHGGVAVLDGGLQAWVAAGGELNDEPPRRRPRRSTPGCSGWPTTGRRRSIGRACANAWARSSCSTPGEPHAIGARPSRSTTIPGHIPTSVNAPTDGNLLEPGGRFLPPSALRARFDGLRAAAVSARAAEPDGAVVTSCGSGVSAAHNALAMRLAGLSDPILYVGSYSDWSRAGELVTLGPEPGRPLHS